MTRTKALVRPALVLFGFVLSTACFGQVPAGREEPPRPADSALPGLGIKPPAPPSTSLPVASINVTRFRFSGLTVVDRAELERVVAPWTGRQVSGAELSQAANAVTEHLRRRGLFVAHAYFPEQNVSDGVVEMAIAEGRLGRVTIEMPEESRLRKPVAEAMLAPLQPGILIRRGEFDTPLLILNDLPGVTVTPVLTQGREPGTADVGIRLADDPLLGGFLRLTNHEQRELGRYELTAHLRLRNPLGIGDLATAEFLGSDTGGRVLGTFSYSLPVNSLGTRVGAIYRNQHADVGGDFEALGINGTWTRWIFQARHPFVRTDERSLDAGLQYTHINYRDRIDAVSFSSETRHRYGSATLRADAVDRVLGSGRSVLSLGIDAGRVDLDPSGAAADATGLRVNGEFQRMRVRLERTQAVTSSSEIALAGTAQFASKNLDAGLELGISGPYSVRGYPVEELFADQGWFATIEFRYRLPFGDPWRFQTALFADQGRGDINKNPLGTGANNTRRLSAYGLAIRAAGPGQLSAGLTLAWRGRQEPVTDPDRNPRVWFTVQKGF